MRNKLYILMLMIFVVLRATSQEVVQKVTKTTDYRFEDCSSLIIQGEKATVRIIGKPQSQIELKLSVIAKHKNSKTALNDLKYIRFSSEKEGKRLLLKNFYETSNKNIESNLSVLYELIVPEQLSIQLKNLYGAVSMSHLKGPKTIEIAFGKLELQSIDGNTRLDLKYTNWNGQKLNGVLVGNLSKSDADIKSCSADVGLNTMYGNVSISLTDDCNKVQVNAKRTEVLLYTPSTDYNMNLKTSFSEVLVFEKEVSNPYKLIVKSSPKTIQIISSYCPIKIKLK